MTNPHPVARRDRLLERIEAGDLRPEHVKGIL